MLPNIMMSTVGSLSKPLQFKHKTLERDDSPGIAHSLTFSCFKRRKLLTSDRAREWFIDALNCARVRHRFDLWAYVLMPEHVHVLVFPRDMRYSVGRFLASVKLPVARRAVAYVKEHAPHQLFLMRDVQPYGSVSDRFWQRGGGYDRSITGAKTIRATIDYLHANPVRRGLVESPADWRWSSAAYYAGEADIPLVPDVGSIPALPPKRNG